MARTSQQLFDCACILRYWPLLNTSYFDPSVKLYILLHLIPNFLCNFFTYFWSLHKMWLYITCYCFVCLNVYVTPDCSLRRAANFKSSSILDNNIFSNRDIYADPLQLKRPVIPDIRLHKMCRICPTVQIICICAFCLTEFISILLMQNKRYHTHALDILISPVFGMCPRRLCALSLWICIRITALWWKNGWAR